MKAADLRGGRGLLVNPGVARDATAGKGIRLSENGRVESPTMLGSGSAGAGSKYLSDNGTYKALSVGATVATSVAGLGTPANGSLGFLRIGGSGSAPFYDLLAVIYDSTYGHWVSNPVESIALGVARSTSATEAFCGFVNTGSISNHAFASRLSDYNTAGLTPQVRWVFTNDSNSGGTMTYKGYTASGNDGAVASVFTNQFTSSALGTGAVATRSGWRAIGTTALTNDILWVRGSHTSSSTTAADSAGWAELRWIG